MKADFWPADLKSELSRFEKKKKTKPQQEEQEQTNSLLVLSAYDEAFLKKFSETCDTTKLSLEKLSTIFNNELKICLPQDLPKVELVDIGKQSGEIATKMSKWDKVANNVFIPVKIYTYFFFRIPIPY